MFYSHGFAVDVMASSRAGSLPQGNAFQMWERACSGRRSDDAFKAPSPVYAFARKPWSPQYLQPRSPPR
ncbi:hypothetical protein C1Y11_10085 [Pseudomonas sp. FW305-20]|nr:hypothetical protein C1Y11_10085 [Pseudomonas sp. FW305-20]PMU20493.1 hypothetical protein C1Y10_05660 [Pseudomonas sp. FW305-122]PMU40061.1 hypothetical protein C1Y12_12205 [Pseudomonas sp. FW305-47B]PMX63478.1 hypothetical protein C1Y13_07135 [Pseudomonas sp. FW305-33]PMX66557.1 hypothetical protein C1X12_16690 [Pseudomonas sp. FW305-60]